MKLSNEERLWRDVTKTPHCWLWTRSVNNKGYGLMWANRRLELVHRLSWMFANGPIPPGQYVLHRCDTPTCVRPDHLFLGDQFENMRDRFAKRRHRTGAFDPSTRPRLRLSQVQRFWSRVRKGPNCWNFTGTPIRGNRGVLRFDGRQQVASRVSWQIANGPIPDGLNVCHRCDNPGCVRPDHLFLGTQAENLRDMRAKGRGYVFPSRAGENNQHAKLTDAAVRTIRADHANGVRVKVIAQQHGVTAAHIYYVVHKKAWRHVIS